MQTHADLAFLDSPGPPTQGMVLPTVEGWSPLLSVNNQDSPHTDKPTGQPNPSHYPTETPEVTLGYVKLTVVANEHKGSFGWEQRCLCSFQRTSFWVVILKYSWQFRKFCLYSGPERDVTHHVLSAKQKSCSRVDDAGLEES